MNTLPFLNLPTRQVSDVVRYDEKILEVSRCTLPLEADVTKDEILVIARRQSDRSVLGEHAARVRELLDFSPIIPTPIGLSGSKCSLFPQHPGGLLTQNDVGSHSKHRDHT